MTWLDSDEICLVSAEAQKIHDDIASGFLTIHQHAHGGHTTVAVGTYQHAHSAHLHGENHLRVVSGSGEAIADFERLYGDAVRTGPALATDTEQQTARAIAALSAAKAAHIAGPPRNRRHRRSGCRCTRPTPVTMRHCWTRSSRNRASGRSTGPGGLHDRRESRLLRTARSMRCRRGNGSRRPA